MAEYVRFPTGLLVLWAAVSTGMWLVPLPPPEPGNPVAADSGETAAIDAPSAPAGENILSSSGNENFSLRQIAADGTNGPAIAIEGDSSFTGAKIFETSDEKLRHLRLVLSNGTTFLLGTLTIADGSFVLSRPSIGASNIVRPDSEGFTVLSPTSSTLFRVKLKEEKFNILDPNGQRILHGKVKNGRIVVRDEGDRDVRWISFDRTLPVAAQLNLAARASLPLPIESRALLIAVAAGASSK